MKYRDSYRVEAKEKNDREEFSVELEDVFFDSVSDHCAEQNKNLSVEYEENNTNANFKAEEGEYNNASNLKKRGRRRKKHKLEARQLEHSPVQTEDNERKNSAFTGIVVERSKPRLVLKQEDGKREMENRFFAELKSLKEHFHKKKQDLCVINFSSCQVGKNKARLISSALKSGAGLQVTASFDCSNNVLKNAGSRLLAQAIKESDISFILLDLSKNKVGDEGAACLFKSLESQKVLSTLNLSCNNVGPTGVKALVEYLRQASTGPESIDISYNHIGDDGAFDIANILLSSDCGLRWLNLCNNSISSKGTEALILSLFERRVSRDIQHFHLDLSNSYYSKEVLDKVQRLKEENSDLEIVLSPDYLEVDVLFGTSPEGNNHLHSSEAEEDFDSTGEGWCNCESVQDIFNAANTIESCLWNAEKTLFCPEPVNDAYENIIRYLDEELNFNENDNSQMLSSDQLQEDSNYNHSKRRIFDSKSQVYDLPPAVRATVELLDILMQPLFDDMFEGCSHKALTGEEIFQSHNEKDNEVVTPNTICSQSGIVFPRLGYCRYKCIEIIWKLVCFRFQCIDDLLSYQGILSRCLELLSEYPQSNCFQNVLLKIFEEAFSSERNSDILIRAFIRPWSFASNTAYNILDVIRDVYILNSLLNRKFPKIGNLSALSTISRFARVLKRSAEQVQEIRMALEETKEWFELQEEIFPKLLEMASSYPLGDELSCLGESKPARSSYSTGPQIDWAAIFRGFPGNSFSRLSLGR